MINFFAYRHPQGNEIISGTSQKCMRGFHKNSFVIAPFFSKEVEVISIPKENELPIEDFDILIQKEQLFNDFSIYDFPEQSTTKEKHIATITQVIRKIRDKELEKCVISRVISEKGKISLTDTFKNLSEAYPEAFIFLYHTPYSGTWIGASPELLMSYHDEQLDSMALAGTRKRGVQGKWSEKNIYEHEIVSSYILDTLRNKGIRAIKEDTKTIAAGPVEHLMTKVHASSVNGNEVFDILKNLSPTPALSGYPRDKSIEIISGLEEFKRGFYGGYCGWFDSKGEFDFFVNLRSMRVEAERYCVFVGGGIVASSEPETEWIETQRKSETILSQLSRKKYINVLN